VVRACSIQRKPLAAILEEIKVSDTYIRGLALEALAFKLMRLLDLEYVATRLRETAGNYLRHTGNTLWGEFNEDEEAYVVGEEVQQDSDE
jgi:hypothetical protein